MNRNKISFGKTTYSFEKLKLSIHKETGKIATTINIKEREKIGFSFWTSDFPELICEAVFTKIDQGIVIYELDFTRTTL